MRLMLILLCVLSVSSCSFGLEASEVLVLVNADNPASVSVGAFYMRQRSLPDENIVPLRLGDCAETISYEKYSKQVAQPLRKLLSKPEYQHIRCLLTIYMMPYKIAAPAVSEKEKKLIAELQDCAAEYKETLYEIVLDLAPESGIKAAEGLSAKLAIARKHLSETIAEIKKMPSAGKNERVEGFLELCRPLYGVFSISQMAQQEFGYVYQPTQDELSVGVSSREFVEDAIAEQWGYRKCLEEGYYEHFSRVYGILELLSLLDKSIKKLNGDESSSAFDSELALVKKLPYRLYKWLPNPHRNSLSDRSVMMVSRIDGRSERLCRELITDSVKAQISSERGSVCIDARFSEDDGEGTYKKYDKSLRQTANIFKKADFDVVLEQTEALYRPDEPLKTAFYCGWYSLGSYVDSFDFVPGSVGYHISSLEAVDIRDPSSGQWVASMLERGISATIGAVDEPYLRAFPLPDEFFTELLTGHTTVEAFAKTNPFLSWNIMLIADPLYTPF